MLYNNVGEHFTTQMIYKNQFIIWCKHTFCTELWEDSLSAEFGQHPLSGFINKVIRR